MGSKKKEIMYCTTGDKIVVLPIKEKKSEIFDMPDRKEGTQKSNRELVKGEVKVLGWDKELNEKLQVGSIVHFPRYLSDIINLNGEEHVIMRLNDVRLYEKIEK